MSSLSPGVVSVSSRESYDGAAEMALQKRQHRPLHAQISTLLAEREELMLKNRELAEQNGELQWRLSQAIEDNVARRADTVETAKANELLETSFLNYKETSEVFAAAHLEQQRTCRDLTARLKASEAKTRHVLAQLMHTSTALQAERAECEAAKHARAVEVATLVRHAEAADDELGQLTLLLTTTLGERQWLRDQLAAVLRRQLKLKQQLAEERVQRAQLDAEISTHLAARDADRREREVLAEERSADAATIARLEAALREAEGRGGALQERLQGAQSKHVAALVRSDRADRRLAEERDAMRESARWQWRLAAHFADGAAAARERATVAERMRWSHTSAERCAFVAAAWHELLGKGEQLRLLQQHSPAAGNNGGAGAGGGECGGGGDGGGGGGRGRAPDAEGELVRGQQLAEEEEEEGLYAAAPSIALASSAGAFVSASLALVRATAPLPSGLESLPSPVPVATAAATSGRGDSVGAFSLVDAVRASAASPGAPV